MTRSAKRTRAERDRTPPPPQQVLSSEELFLRYMAQAFGHEPATLASFLDEIKTTTTEKLGQATAYLNTTEGKLYLLTTALVFRLYLPIIQLSHKVSLEISSSIFPAAPWILYSLAMLPSMVLLHKSAKLKAETLAQLPGLFREAKERIETTVEILFESLGMGK
jgi:hypothetical protein